MAMQALKTKHLELVKYLKHLETYGFVKLVGETPEKFRFGPPGEVVVQNVRQEWLYSTVTYRDVNVFPFHADSELSFDCPSYVEELSDGFSSAKFLSGDSIPFGLAFSRTVQERVTDDVLQPRKHVELRQMVFENPQISKQLFYRHLQQRKRWWRKFSTDPGKFSFSDVIKPRESSVAEEAHIRVSFPWGDHKVETVRFLSSEPLDSLPLAEQNTFAVLCNRKRFVPHIIESSMNLDFAALVYMFDAYSEKKTGKPIMKFHRKLSPYKYGFAAGSTSSATARELFDLSRMICLDLKKLGWSCLFPPAQDLGKKSLDAQLSKHDALGVCYTIVLNEGSLKTGLCGLYNRETTLQEQTHVSKLPDYCSLIMKNY